MLRKLCALVLLAGLAAAPLAAADDSWVSIGPWGGSVASLVVNPRNPLILYAGTAGGLYKSTDGGLSWVDIQGNLPSRIVMLAIAPSAPSTLYVAVGRSLGSYGVFHSTDGGSTWQSWQRGFGYPGCECISQQIDSLAVHPRNPKIVVASGQASLFKSSDGGVKWTRIATGNLLAQVEALVFPPTQPAILYAGSFHGVVKSTNGGSSWTSASTGLGDMGGFGSGAATPPHPRSLQERQRRRSVADLEPRHLGPVRVERRRRSPVSGNPLGRPFRGWDLAHRRRWSDLGRAQSWLEQSLRHRSGDRSGDSGCPLGRYARRPLPEPGRGRHLGGAQPRDHKPCEWRAPAGCRGALSSSGRLDRDGSRALPELR